jgi:FlaG protein
MDVQATAATATALPPSISQIAPSAPAAPSAGLPPAPTISVVSGTDPGSSAGNGTSGSGGSANSAIGATPGLGLLPAGPAPGAKKGEADATLTTGVAKLYNSQEQNVSVSFQVEQNPNEIVTVFTDKSTGKVIVQFPSETLIALAQFFDKLDGTVVNKKV